MRRKLFCNQPHHIESFEQYLNAQTFLLALILLGLNHVAKYQTLLHFLVAKSFDNVVTNVTE